jgi:hypothetical protein
MHKNDLVEIEFRDHVENSTRGVTCFTWGRIQSHNTKEVVIRSWHAAFRSKRDRDANSTDITILRSAIVAVRKLEYK